MKSGDTVERVKFYSNSDMTTAYNFNKAIEVSKQQKVVFILHQITYNTLLKLDLLKKHGKILEHLSNELKNDKEIVLQETISMSGGAGQYLSRIFDYKNDEIVEIFSSLI